MKLLDSINSLLLGKTRTTPSGWQSINCPACIHNGEPTPDTRHRGGIKIGLDGSVSFNCLRCHFKSYWRPGIILNKKMQNFLLYLGMSYDDIQKLTFAVWRENQLLEISEKQNKKTEVVFFNKNFPEVELPKESKPIITLLEENYENSDFLDAVNYLINERGSIISRSYDYYWSAEKEHRINRSIIIPFYYENKIVGWAARRIDKQKIRYYAQTPKDYLFMNHNLYKKNRKYVFLVEGVFDAIAIDGIASLGGSINKNQINWIISSGLEPVVIPDRSKDASTLIDVALEYNWYVSIPPLNNTPSLNSKGELNIWSWHSNIKDCADAVKQYGRLFTIQSILENKTKDVVKIKLFKKMFVR